MPPNPTKPRKPRKPSRALQDKLGREVMDEVEFLGNKLLELRAMGFDDETFKEQHSLTFVEGCEVISKLIQNGADTEVQDEDGKTPLDEAFDQDLPPSIICLLVPSLYSANEWLLNRLQQYQERNRERGMEVVNRFEQDHWRVIETVPKELSSKDLDEWYAMDPALKALHTHEELQVATAVVAARRNNNRL